MVPEVYISRACCTSSGTTKQAMNYLLGQLQQLGYLSRDDDPDDQRSKPRRGREIQPCTDCHLVKPFHAERIRDRHA